MKTCVFSANIFISYMDKQMSLSSLNDELTQFLFTLLCGVALTIPNYCELFKKVTGSTFSEYITDRKMKKARELPSDNKLTIDQIGEETWHGDYCYFNSLFKKRQEVAIFQYRKIFGATGSGKTKSFVQLLNVISPYAERNVDFIFKNLLCVSISCFR